MRSQIVAGNWKSNLNFQEAKSLLAELSQLKKDFPKDVQVAIACPFPYLGAFLNESDGIHLSAQNSSANDFGAFTGEVHPEMLMSMGIDHVIIGHSERRSMFGDNNEVVAQKVKRAVNAGMHVFFCCGEGLEHRDENAHFDWVKMQIESALFDLDETAMKQIVIAYEPIWAIGTGRTASAEQAQEMHEAIRSWLKEEFSEECANNTSILYGGSCKPSNAKEIFAQKDVDGGLIGGASLKAEDFNAIIHSF